MRIVSISKELKAFRIRNKYTQEKMSQILDVDIRSIRRYENGSNRPSDNVMTRIYNLMPYLKNGNKLACIYDYVRIRIPNMSPTEVIEKLLRLKVGMFSHETSKVLNYNTMYQLDNIRVLYDEPELTNKEVLIEMTGQGCRQFERFLVWDNREWFNFFKDCFEVNGQFKRIDLAINDYYRFLDIPHLVKKIENGECLTKFRTWRLAGDGGFNGDSDGKTIYFGAPQSNLQVVFYEKDYEQSKKLKIPRDRIDVKNRYELRFAHEYAQDVIKKLMATRDELQTAKDILSTYISFRDKRNSNKKYWPLNLEWSVFLGEVKRLTLEMKPKVELYEKSVNHMFYQYGGLLQAVKEVDGTLGTNQLNEQIDKAKMSPKHFKMMQAYLASTQDFMNLEDL